MARILLLFKLLLGALAATVYVWFAAVRALPRVKRRKALRRTRRGTP